MNLDLQNKTAVVSGSTAGIGLAIAMTLAAEGARVVINGRTEARVTAALGKIRQRVSKAEARGVAADLGTSAGVDSFLGQVTAADILVNNLGIFEPKPFLEIPDADWVRFFEVNVLSGVRLARVSSANAREKLGPHHFYFERIRPANSRRNDSLRHDQDGPDRGGPRSGGIRCRKRCDSKFHSCRANGLGRRRRLCRTHGQGTESHESGARKAIFCDRAAEFASEAVRDTRGSGRRGCICCQRTIHRDQRRRGPRRRRRDSKYSLALKNYARR